jgi:hypothetical protein
MSKIDSRTSLRILNSSVYTYLIKNRPELLDKYFPEQVFGYGYTMKEEVFVNYLNTGKRNRNVKTLSELLVPLPDIDQLPSDVRYSLDIDLLSKYYPESKDFADKKLRYLEQQGNYLSIRSLYYDKYLEYLKRTNSRYFLFRYVKEKIQTEPLQKYLEIIEDIQKMEIKYSNDSELVWSQFTCIDKVTGLIFADFKDMYDKDDIYKSLENRDFLSVRVDLMEIRSVFPDFFNTIVSSKYFYAGGLSKESLRYLIKNGLISLDKIDLHHIFGDYDSRYIQKDLKRNQIRTLDDLRKLSYREIKRKMTFGSDIVRNLEYFGIKTSTNKDIDLPTVNIKNRIKTKSFVSKTVRVNGKWVYE